MRAGRKSIRSASDDDSDSDTDDDDTDGANGDENTDDVATG